MLGSKAARETMLWPCACRTVAAMPTAPKLYSSPRCTASRNDNLPLNGCFAVLFALPAYVPCTWTVGLSVLTLVVVPGIGCCAAVTPPPLCAVRPETGSGVASVPDDPLLAPEPACADSRPGRNRSAREISATGTRSQRADSVSFFIRFEPYLSQKGHKKGHT
jgi:hypothetical protein